MNRNLILKPEMYKERKLSSFKPEFVAVQTIYNLTPRDENLASDPNRSAAPPCKNPRASQSHKGYLYEVFRPVLLYARLIGVSALYLKQEWIAYESRFSYTPHSKPMRTGIVCCVQAIILGYSLFRVFTQKDQLDDFEILNWVWNCSWCTLFSYSISVFACFWRRRQELINIFEQADILQENFEKLEIPLTHRFDKAIAAVICLYCFCGGIVHSLIARRIFRETVPHNINKLSNYFVHFLSFSSWAPGPFVAEIADWARYFCAFFGLILDVLQYMPSQLGDCLRLLCGLVMLRIFLNLKTSLRSGRFSSDDLDKVMEIHLCASKMIRNFNQFLSPITFVSAFQAVILGCYGINFLVWGYGDGPKYAQYGLFIARNVTIFLINAHVCSCAHSISDWLEDLGTGKEYFRSNPVDITRLTIFTSQIYSRETIGFKGFDFFTISYSFVATITSILVTYIVIVSQLKIGADDDEQ